MKTHTEKYFGFDVKGREVQAVGDYYAWLFSVEKGGERIFSYRIIISGSMMGVFGENLVKETLSISLSKIYGMILLGDFEHGESYKHEIQSNFEGIEPKVIQYEFPFENNVEKAQYYIIKGLHNIRINLLPQSFVSGNIDLELLCNFSEIKQKSIYAALNLLEERGYIKGITVPSPTQSGAFEYQTMHITPDGIDFLNQQEIKLIEREKKMSPNLIDDAVFLLGCLYDKGAVSAAHSITSQELLDISGYEYERYDHVDDFLIASGFVDLTMGGLSGIRSITPAGIAWLQEENDKRIPLGFNALRISGLMYEETKNPKIPFISFNIVLEKLSVELDEYLIACQELEDLGLLESKAKVMGNPFHSISLTSSGRNAVRSGYKKEGLLTIQQQVGAVFQGPVHDSNIQAIAVAANSNIQQAIEQGNKESLLVEIDKLIEGLIEVINPELQPDEVESYNDIANKLNGEIREKEPDKTFIQRALGYLAFMGDLDGAVELTNKGIELATRVGPLILLLQKAISQLLN